jgi:hypothetical protein
MLENGRSSRRIVTSCPPIPPASRPFLGVHPLVIDPKGDLLNVEPDELADLHEGHTPFGHKPTHEDDLDAKPLGEDMNIHQRAVLCARTRVPRPLRTFRWA